ncbi:MAG: LysE family translocator [Pseudomonadota bacterium]|nr:LysE family translocator [Pseudomonadota bacterium]
MALSSFLAYTLALGIAAAIPGPGVAALVGRALGTGFRRTMPMLAGLVLGDLLYLTLAILGLALLAHTFETAFLAVRIAGALYLLWLAWKFWTSGLTPERIERAPGRRDGLLSFAAGFAVTMGNPKTIVFYMALLPVVIDMTGVGLVDWAVLFVLTVLILYVVLVPYVALASRARSALANRATLKIVNRSAAIAMTGAAGFILARPG